MDFRIAQQAESDLDDIWYFLAIQSKSIEVSDRVIDSITAPVRTPRAPTVHRSSSRRRPATRLSSFGVGDYVIAYRVDDDNVLIMRVLRGSRDREALFRD